MNNIIDVWVLFSGDGYTNTPIGYYTTKISAIDAKGNNPYYRVSDDPVKAIYVGNTCYLLGNQIEVDVCKKSKQQLIASAKAKLSLAELKALEIM